MIKNMGSAVANIGSGPGFVRFGKLLIPSQNFYLFIYKMGVLTPTS
jgi:hypothetical protein